jgi:adenylate kinase family enzyme
VVYVSGAPGAGKSTVAGRLADRLRLVLVSKDVI